MSGMTREEAIEILGLAQFTGNSASELDAISEALDVAIEALKERPHGEWGKKTFGYLSTHDCSNCGFNGNQLWHFCPNCGADMRGKHE